MQTIRVSLALSLCLAVCLCATATAQQAGRIESMKLLTPNVGWAATNSHLFWTTTAGLEWKDITPKVKAPRTIASVFFLDTLRGWALLAYAGKEDPKTSITETLFELASTSDSGTNWSVQHLDVPDVDSSRGLSGETWLDFVDSQHGWFLVRMNGSTAVSIGVLRATEDGGKTWRSLGVPAAGPIRFVTPTDGWMEGGPTEDVTQGIYATRDGGRNWTLVTLKAPAEVLPKTNPTYHLPRFADKDSGFLLVTFSEPNDESPELALFTTKDGGRTWKLGGALPEGGTSWYTTVVGSDWLAAGCPGGKLALARATGGRISTAPMHANKVDDVCTASGGGVFGVTFGDNDRGWLLLFGGKLLSTSDGGSTWKDITPASAARARVRGRSVTVPVRSERVDGLSAGSPLETPSGNVSTHLGFDRFPVIPTASDMQNWMNSSPYYDVGIYLPGSKNKSPDSNLTPAWLSAVEGQGWGIIPIWFGLQSSCACRTRNPCVPYTYQFSTNATQAKTDGINEANAAISSAQNLGLSPTIIYHDIENYTPDGSTCSQPVQAFLSGWDQQMQTVGKAGVYGNPAPAAQDFSAASPIPDDVWIAAYPVQGKPPQMTIWALGALTDTLDWTTNQRIRQAQQNLIQTWGGTTNYKIDPDIDNATIVNANNGTKTYTYTSTSLDYPGATETYFAGINDISGTALINATGQTGTIVGYYQDSSNNEHGFQYVNGTFTPIDDYPGAAVTFALGINNLGQMVGGWCPATGYCQGFRRSATGTFSNLQYPGSVSTQANGINDAGQVVGQYYNSTGNDHGFLLYAGHPYTIDAGASGTWAVAINGDASIAGTFFSPATSFIEYALPPTWTGTFTSFSYGGGPTYGNGIDNDNDLLGDGSAGGFLLTGNVLITTFPCPGTACSMSGVNDFGQIVGWYQDSSGNYHGFLTVPQ